jgi:putative endonuclease
MIRWSWCARRKEKRPLGKRGEEAAAQYLRQLGYRILAQGVRNKFGELDLVAVDGRTLVLVEVKTWGEVDEESPAAAVDGPKQRRLTRTALALLKSHGLLEYRARFDVIALTWPEDSRQPTIAHFKNAFEPTDEGQIF